MSLIRLISVGICDWQGKSAIGLNNETSRLKGSQGRILHVLYLDPGHVMLLCTISSASLVTFGTSRASRDNLRDTDTEDPSRLFIRKIFGSSNFLLLFYWT